MISINALDRGTGVRRILLNAAAATLKGLSLIGETAFGWIASSRFVPRELSDARLVKRPGMVLAEMGGSPERIGEQGGQLLAAPTRTLMRVMGLFPAQSPARTEALTDGIHADHRAELRAYARAARIDAGALQRANLVVDTCCSALVSLPDAASGRPLMVARNMDFFPAAVLGRATVVSVVRPLGKHAFASVGWPGYNGVISGMNARGLSACILLNYGSVGARAGTPIAYRAREVLEGASTVDEAAALFASTAIASSHYLLLADASSTAIVWQDEDGVHRHDPRDGWLACSNGERDLASGLAVDDRGRCLRALAGSVGANGVGVDEAWMRAATTASYLTGINAQAMVFVPGRRVLQLAVGTASEPAAAAAWSEVDLSAALDGASVGTLEVVPLGRPGALQHYSAIPG